MDYYEVLIADGRYHSSAPLTYSYEEPLDNMAVVSVPLRQKLVTGIVMSKVDKPPFKVKPVKSRLSSKPLPYHCLELAGWLRDYYACNYGEALRQFAPASTVIRRSKDEPENEYIDTRLDLDTPLSTEQNAAITAIETHPSTTVLLHGETGSGKTRVYMELAGRVIGSGKSVIILTPEIALTSQLAAVAKQKLEAEVLVLHSELTTAERKKIWFRILEASTPQIIIGPRSALFTPVENLGLIVVDEAHEPAYKQDQAPRYHAVRVASQLGLLTGARVVLGSATPAVADYYVAKQKDSIVEMRTQAKTGELFAALSEIIDLKDKNSFKKNHYLSDRLLEAIGQAVADKKQVLIYYNRRGSARIILCDNCGWQMVCPNCDIPLVYHADEHVARCHICGWQEVPPAQCPTCTNPDIIYKSIGSKTLEQIVRKLFPSARVARFDSDNLPGERLNEVFAELKSGQVDILVGTQLLAKGLDLPNLGLVGVVAAESSLSLPDYGSEERTYQLLYQVIGRAGRGRADDRVIVQTFDPESPIIQAALKRDWQSFYDQVIEERQMFRFPPFSYLLKLTCRRATAKGAENAALKLRDEFQNHGLPIEVVGPTPSFYARRGKNYYYQLVVKSKDRRILQRLAAQTPAGWSVDLDPADLL